MTESLMAKIAVQLTDEAEECESEKELELLWRAYVAICQCGLPEQVEIKCDDRFTAYRTRYGVL